LTRKAEAWTLQSGAAAAATTLVSLTDDAAWQLLFNALPATDTARHVRVEGKGVLAAPLLTARSVVV
jgi:hypothetical protein